MKTEEIISKIKKNTQLSRSEKKELIEFWKSYVCPLGGDVILIAEYTDGENVEYTVENRLAHFYDETPKFIEAFFNAMAKFEKFRTGFAWYSRSRIKS